MYQMAVVWKMAEEVVSKMYTCTCVCCTQQLVTGNVHVHVQSTCDVDTSIVHRN